jgi:hypothetical protein
MMAEVRTVSWSLEEAYDEYPRIEAEFSAALDQSMNPRGPDVLYELVAKQEHHGRGGRKLLHAERLLRGRDGFVRRYGQSAYDFMLGDCLWHIYGMIGKLTRRAYLLSRPD